MRSPNKRSRSKSNRPKSLGNVVNRVFDSSGPEGKVRGTPQQIIEKYQVLARDAQLSNDRIAAENFQQHAEHYTRMLAEAQRELAAEQEARRLQQEERNQRQQEDRARHNQRRDDRRAPSDQQAEDAPTDTRADSSFGVQDAADTTATLVVDTPENKAVDAAPQDPAEAPAPKPVNRRKPRVTRAKSTETETVAKDAEAPKPRRAARGPRKVADAGQPDSGPSEPSASAAE